MSAGSSPLRAFLFEYDPVAEGVGVAGQPQHAAVLRPVRISRIGMERVDLLDGLDLRALFAERHEAEPAIQRQSALAVARSRH